MASGAPLATGGASICGVFSSSCLPLGLNGSAPGRIRGAGALAFAPSMFILVPPCSLVSCGGLLDLILDGTPGQEIGRNAVNQGFKMIE